MLAHTGVVKPLLNWKLAICQHPMYLLIDEDRGEPAVGERVPPWGAPDAASYVERIHRNLSSLEHHDDLCLNYEFSGVELEAMAAEFPDAMQRMREYFQEGRLDFIGGTFSQPHMQAIGAESNWRQLEMGLAIFEKLFGKRVKVHYLQETGQHQQMPQILKRFGFEVMVAPPFPWTMEIFEGRFECTGMFRGLDTIESDEFVEAVALDGSSLPYYIKVLDGEHERGHEDMIMGDISKGLPRGPSLWTLFPDMMEIEEDFYNSRKQLFDFVLLERELKDQLRKAPPRAKARIYTNWSYTEGVWADALLRANHRSEQAALLTEALLVMAKMSGIDCEERHDLLHNIWHTILKYQHHDVNWIEVTDLRRKAISKIERCIAECQAIMEETACELVAKGKPGMTVFNGLAHPRKCLLDQPFGSPFPGLGQFQEVDGRVLGWIDLPAGGAASYAASDVLPLPSVPSPIPNIIKTRHYEVQLDGSGLMKQITTGAGESLLAARDCFGGEIRAMINDAWVDNRAAEIGYMRGPVADVLVRRAHLDSIPIIEKYFFFHDEPLIRAELEFDFNGNEAGYFWMDETKINVHYPLAACDTIWHDIPFGYIQARQGRALFATSWIYSGGLIYVNQGMPKHWVKNGVLTNMIAWGGHSFTNRMQFGWAKQTMYDLRLYGSHKIKYDIIPAGAFDGREITRRAGDLIEPIFATAGELNRSFYHVRDRELCLTSVHHKDGNVMARGYQLPTGGAGRFRDWEIFNCQIGELL
ncbi:MAG: hypothetical protein WCK47_04655 [bacterium]|nr:hypothetical protein [Candidatus Sumerlaeota bacterium]